MAEKSPRLIALYSTRPQMGKSTVADHLVEFYGYTRVKFATPIKHMVRTLLVYMGMNPLIAERYVDGDLKDEVVPGLGKTGRELLISLGTDWGRNMVDNDIWATIGAARIQNLVHQGLSVVVDDMRFANEYQALCIVAGFKSFWRIHKGPLYTLQRESAETATEGRLDNYLWDYAITAPEGDVVRLMNKVDTLMHQY